MLNTTRANIETIAAASTSIANIEFVGCGGSTAGFVAGAFEDWGTGLADGGSDDAVPRDCKSVWPLLLDDAPEVIS